MREKAIESMVGAGVPRDRAEKYWALLVQRVCGGDEPSEGDVAALADEDVLGPFKADNLLAGRKLLAALRAGKAEPAKAKRFKAAKASGYTAADLALFVAEDPKGATEGLRAFLDAKVGGEPFRLVVSGKLDQEATAARIEALAAGDPVAPFVVVGGVEVVPVGWDLDDAAVEDGEDPFQRGAPLGQPGDVSGRLGVSLEGVSHEARQAIDCARQRPHELADASLRELQAVAELARGKGADDVLAEMPKARRAWGAGWKRRELKVPRRPFVEPTAPKAPRGGRGVPANLEAICAAVSSAGLDRRALLAGIDRALVASLATSQTPGAQTRLDVLDLFEVGGSAWESWLTNAESLSGPRREAAVFRSALDAARSPAPSAPPLIHVVAAAEDARLGETLRKHLSQAVRQGRVRVVVNGDVRAGQRVSEAREASVREAAVVAFLATADSLAEFDVDELLRSHPRARVVPVVARHCAWRHTGLASKASLPRAGLADSDEKWSEVAAELSAIAEGAGR